jgi:hypothetical protein
MGNLNQDEGWYAYAALQVAQGQWPFLDFAYTQAPALPLVYALFACIIESSGIFGARLITVLLGLAGTLVFTTLAVRLAPVHRKGWTALCVFSLVALNSYQSYFTSVLKTYSLTLLCLSLLAWFLMGAVEKESRGRALLAGVFGALAVGTRLSAIAALAAAAILLWVHFRNLRHPCVSSFWAGAVLFGGLIFAPFLLLASDNAYYGMVAYHGAREVGSAFSLAVYKLGFISRLTQAYSLWFLTAVVLVCARCWMPRDRDSEPSSAGAFMESFLWWGGLGMTFLHFIAAFPYDDYQVPVYPMLVVAVLLPILRRLPAAAEMRRAPAVFSLVLVCAAGLAAVASPVNQDWMIRGRDRIWWKLKSSPDLCHLNQAASWLQEQGAESPLFTQDTYLAVEAGLDVPEGLEMGPFSFYADWPDALADSHHVMNLQGMKTLIAATSCTYAAISGYGLSIRSPEVAELSPDHKKELMDLLLKHYEPVKEFPYFGQGHTTLTIYKRRANQESTP